MLRFEDIDGLLCPVFACDVCGRPAQYGAAGDEFGCLIQWDDYKNPTWTVLHKGHCLHVWERVHTKDRVNRGWQGWRDLNVFTTQLKNNTLHPFQEELPEKIQERQQEERREARDKRLVLTYYARSLDGNIKIGKSVNPRARMFNLNGGVVGASHIELLAVEFEDVEYERHRQFAHLRLTGEWFQPGQELVDHIETLDGSLDVLDTETEAS